MKVLDLGGTASAWQLCPESPAHLTLLNIFDQDAADAQAVVGDACEPPAWLLAERFDLIYSNSVIEHVGGHHRREQFAEAVHSLGTHHWIQTPNRYFPIEPHFLCPGLQYLPLPVGMRVARLWPVGHYAHASSKAAAQKLQCIELLGMTQMRYYFPRSEILREQVGPVAKSLIACL
jgi:hypothetical protein